MINGEMMVENNGVMMRVMWYISSESRTYTRDSTLMQSIYVVRFTQATKNGVYYKVEKETAEKFGLKVLNAETEIVFDDNFTDMPDAELKERIEKTVANIVKYDILVKLIKELQESKNG